MNDIFWINQQGHKVFMSDMTDGYLFNTVKCIWNNKIGKHAPFGKVIGWTFIQPVHTDAFLTEFFNKGLAELRARELKWRNELCRVFIEHVDYQLGVKLDRF